MANTHNNPGMVAVQRGFTLVELVVTIVLMGILGAGTVSFLMTSTESYVDTSVRNQLGGLGRLTITKLERVIRTAVPNSLRVTSVGAGGDQCLEYLPLAAATSYLDVSFISASNTITMVPFDTGLNLSGTKYVVIFPMSAGTLYSASSPGPLATTDYSTSSTANSIETLTLTTSHQFSSGSVTPRLYLSDAPVSFCLSSGKLYRYKNYGLKASQCTPATANFLPSAPPDRALIADQIDNSSYTTFNYTAGTLQSFSLLQFDFNFKQGSEALLMRHEIQVRNAP